MPASLSRSREYSWSDDWQSGRTTCKGTEIRKLKSRSNQNRISLSKNNFMATERNILLVKHAPIQTVSPHFPFSLVLEWLCQQYLQPTCKRNLEARTSSCQNSTASPKWHFMPRLFGEQVCLASQYFKGEYQKYWSTLLCEPDVAKLQSPKENTLDKFSLKGTPRDLQWASSDLVRATLPWHRHKPWTISCFSSSENECRKHVGAGWDLLLKWKKLFYGTQHSSRTGFWCRLSNKSLQEDLWKFEFSLRWGSSRSLRASGSSDSSMGAGRGSSVGSKLLRLHRKSGKCVTTLS